jgi:hypothetical protein
MDNPDQGCLARLREAEVQPGFVAQLQATLNVIPARLFSRYQQKYQQIGRLGSDENKR